MLDLTWYFCINGKNDEIRKKPSRAWGFSKEAIQNKIELIKLL